MKLTRLLLGWIAALLTAACTSAGDVTPTVPLTPFKPPTATPGHAATAIPAAGSATVTPTGGALPTASAPVEIKIPADDGVQIVNTYHPPILQSAGQRAPAILLLHMVGGAGADWQDLPTTLQAQGFAVLVPDLRGHGRTAGPGDWAKGPSDVRALWDALMMRPEVDPGRSGIVGASIGANLALIVGANTREVATVIALSPGLEYHDLKPLGLMPNFGYRPVLLVASQDDNYSYSSTPQLGGAASAAQTFYYTDAGHGTAMLVKPDLKERILDWLTQYLGVGKG
jgi:pimeloyl-ACP methyl ester carboxylesterase